MANYPRWGKYSTLTNSHRDEIETLSDRTNFFIYKTLARYKYKNAKKLLHTRERAGTQKRAVKV